MNNKNTVGPIRDNKYTQKKDGAKRSVGDIQQERVEVVMKREELSLAWLRHNERRQQLEEQLLHQQLFMNNLENQLSEIDEREKSLRRSIEIRMRTNAGKKGYKYSKTTTRLPPVSANAGFLARNYYDIKTNRNQKFEKAGKPDFLPTIKKLQKVQQKNPEKTYVRQHKKQQQRGISYDSCQPVQLEEPPQEKT